MAFKSANIFSNLFHYLGSVFILIDGDNFTLALIFIFILLIALAMEDLVTIILLFCFVAFLFPALLFTDRVAPYYLYYPLIFFLAAIARIFSGFFNRRKLFAVGNMIVLLFLFIFLFYCVGVQKYFLDNCFLSLFPWKNAKKQNLASVSSRINSSLEVNGDFPIIIPLTSEEQDSLLDVLDGQVLFLFLDKDLTQRIQYKYESGSIVLDKR